MRKLITLAIAALVTQYVVTGCAPADNTNTESTATTGSTNKPTGAEGEKKSGLEAPGGNVTTGGH